MGNVAEKLSETWEACKELVSEEINEFCFQAELTEVVARIKALKDGNDTRYGVDGVVASSVPMDTDSEDGIALMKHLEDQQIEILKKYGQIDSSEAPLPNDPEV